MFKYLDWSKANSDLLMNLIDDILDYTLISENKLSLVPEKFKME